MICCGSCHIAYACRAREPLSRNRHSVMNLQTCSTSRNTTCSNFHRVQSASRHALPSRDQSLLCAQVRRSRPAGARCQAAAADAGDDGSEDYTGSEAWRQRPAALALPGTAQQPESWFMMAGFLKMLLLATTPYGFLIPGGPPDLLTMLPIGFGLMFLANLALQRGLERRRWFSGILLVVSMGVIYVIRAISSGPAVPMRVQRPPVAAAPSAATSRPHKPLPTAADAEAMGIKWDTPRPMRPDDAL